MQNPPQPVPASQHQTHPPLPQGPWTAAACMMLLGGISNVTMMIVQYRQQQAATSSAETSVGYYLFAGAIVSFLLSLGLFVRSPIARWTGIALVSVGAAFMVIMTALTEPSRNQIRPEWQYGVAAALLIGWLLLLDRRPKFVPSVIGVVLILAAQGFLVYSTLR